MSQKFDNVWNALFDDNSEAENLRIRSHLMIIISKFILDHNFTQEKAAELFGVSQPRVSDIIKGKIGKFTIDSLVNIITKMGSNVDFTVTDKKITHGETSVSDAQQSPWPFKLIHGGRKNNRIVHGFSIDFAGGEKLNTAENGKFACIG